MPFNVLSDFRYILTALCGYEKFVSSALPAVQSSRCYCATEVAPRRNVWSSIVPDPPASPIPASYLPRSAFLLELFCRLIMYATSLIVHFMAQSNLNQLATLISQEAVVFGTLYLGAVWSTYHSSSRSM